MSGLNDYLPPNMANAIQEMAATPDVTQFASTLPSSAAVPQLSPPQAGAFPSAQPAMQPSVLPGADAAMQARITQALANPNAGDAFSPGMAPAGMAAANAMQPEAILPGSPGELAAGAAVGSAFGLGMMAVKEKWNGFERLATAIDRAPGIRQVSDAMNKRVANVKNPGLREWLTRDAIEKGSPTAIANMERRQLTKMSGGYAKVPELRTLLGQQKTFAGAQTALQQKITLLENKPGKLSKDEHKLLKSYRGAFHSIKGMDSISYKPVYAQQAAQNQRLAAKGVGPIGRGIANMSLYTQRIFGGDTLKSMFGGNAVKGAETGASKWLGRLFPSALGGAFIFGSAISKARKAEEGEKTSTFMRDFLGIGLGSFIGWEVGQKVLTAIGFRGMMDKVGNKIGIGNISNRLLTPGRGLLEKLFSPATITKITRFLPKLTFGGTAVGLISMFVFGGIFQKIFEKVSDTIFGKPSEASLKGQGQAAQAQGNGLMPGILGNPMTAASAPAFSLAPQQMGLNQAAAQNAAGLQSQLGL